MIPPPNRAFAQAIEAADALAGFQTMLRYCPTDTDRKQLILAAHDHGALTVEAAMLLISANMVEAA